MTAEVAFLPSGLLDFGPVHRGEMPMDVRAAGLSRSDLARASDALCDLHLALIADAIDEDVSFTPVDPAADDDFGDATAEPREAWTLAHVIAHVTASSESSAFLALGLARGVIPSSRARTEVPWRSLTTVHALRHRYQESRRMRLAMLDAWPDRPDMESSYIPWEGFPPYNCVTRFIGGLWHEDQHTGQFAEIMRQARAARRGAARPSRRGEGRPRLD